ncbi:MAG: hypothetical protein H0V24_07090, partial [Chloroflexia bacterium]|nr:hypothetical protein [Chloroflexia bacterium]
MSAMRNLLGRLHARDDAELTRIAAFWRAPLASGNRHLAVGALYRLMTDIRTVRATWERLNPAQQEMVRLLALAEDGRAAPTLVTLAGWLELPEAAAREVAVQLYRAGLLAREGDDQPLPVGTEPKLFLPRELALLVRRLLDDVDAGDLSAVPLTALLERLDDAEIEVAATCWGLKVVPSTRNRDDLGRRLLRQIGTPGGVDQVVSKLSADAARAWRAVREGDDGRPVRLDDVAAAIGLDADEARTFQRWRTALDELESALLVWHTYDAGGARWLFIPAEIRLPALPVPLTLPPLQPVLPATEATPWRHPDAFAWDFLTLLRELSDPGLPPWPATGEQPRSRLRRLNSRFWFRGRELPDPGYVDCLLALAIAEGLVRVDEEAETELQVTSAVRGWRERSFPAQTERLRWWWMASAEWIEGRTGGEVEVWGADWPSARRNLLAALIDPAVGLEPDTWYTLDSVAARIAAYLPGLLGTSFTAATARVAPGNGEEASTRLATIAEVIGIELVTMFAWLGLVEPRTEPGLPRSIRVTPAAARRGPAAETTASESGPPPVVVSPTGAIEIHDSTPLRVWSVSAFADLELLGASSVYRLSAGSIQRALAAGFDLGQVTAFLTRQSGSRLPD